VFTSGVFALFAATSSTGSGSGSGLPFLVIIIVVFGLLFLYSRRNRQRQGQQLANVLVPGADVVTRGGIYGRIVDLTDTDVVLQVEDGTRIRFLRGAVAGPAPGATPPEPGNPDERPADDSES
jgi:preprotein translocase subunit YajC